MFKIYLLTFLSVCFCNAYEYDIIPLDSVGETYDLSMIRPPLGPNTKGQYMEGTCFNDPLIGKIPLDVKEVPTFISDSGHVIGFYNGHDIHPCNGYIWSAENGFQDILPVHTLCTPKAVNNKGEVIFQDQERWHAAYYYTFLVTSDGRTLPVEFNSRRAPEGSCFGNALNDNTQVVGRFKGYYFGIHAFVWDEKNGIRDLRTLIPQDSGWSDLIEAKYINNDGLIVGNGIFNGEPREFLLIPLTDM